MRKEKDISGCGITGIMNEQGDAFSGEDAVVAICNMMERGNGLGAGFAGYGIYPELKDYWCFHLMYHNQSARVATEEYMNTRFKIPHHETIPTKKIKTVRPPIPSLYRYFVEINDEMGNGDGREQDMILGCAMEINRHIEGAFVFSSGKNMGVFKGVGNPDEIAEFYQIPEYKGYIWTAHNRFPTNSPGWWGGAHPFGILDWSVIHNGEISSYGINRRYLENFGYYCCLSTDTEVMAYLFDLLVRRHVLSFELVGKILAAPFWSQIERVENKEEKAFLRSLRTIYGSVLVNGPFAVVVANSTHMVGLNDRIKLRPLVAARKGNFLYISSEEAAIREVCKDLETVWMPKAGEATIGRLRDGQA
ncbi:MAG: glutamine amidotransferase family protein [Deltaproteobacteria bacterium]|nr:MAG: glutamine amidotransferase family protein [Deltaproteobacteria bacterium]